jgi:hypothetical protein
MMRSQCSGLVWVALLSCGALSGAVLWGCDDDAEVKRGVDSSSVAEQPEPGGGTSSSGAGGRAGTPPAALPRCVAADCPEVMALGSAAAGCCQTDGTCGGLVMVNGSPLCAPPNVDNLVAGAGSTLMQLSAETVQEDPTCSERNILGTRLPGCCDQTGVCGVSTTPVASGSPGAIPGLNLPVTCVSPAEAAQLGGGMAALGTTMPQLCGGAADAGVVPARPPVEPPLTPPAVAPGDAGADAGEG